MRGLQKIILAGAVILITPACHDDGFGEHGCPLDYSSGWGSYGLSVEHQEPKMCPVFIPSPGSRLETGAAVVDGGERDFVENRLIVQDAARVYVTGKIGIFGRDAQGRWISANYVGYPAGRAGLGPDDVYFDLSFNGGGAGPSAHMKVSYTDAVSASISGPGIVLPGGSYTWSASIRSGQPPFQYRWYRNWNMVGTGSSYTGAGGGDTTLLRVDVIDARGEVDSHSRRVITNYCDGARIC
jgi:hypothetical protein